MTNIVEVHGVSKNYGDTAALQDVAFSVRENTITGLLGRNGAGKTTMMRILTGHEFADGGHASVFGESPLENSSVLSRICFIAESQHYPDSYRVRHALNVARRLYPNWDEAYARELIEEFQLPVNRMVKKLSRGMRSALGAIIGLASRAPLTFFDEPYLGLDAVARQLFYDQLLADYAEHPRTIVLSTHLIDEASDLIEHVVVIDGGKILIDSDAEELRGDAFVVAGPLEVVNELAAGRPQLRREQLGNSARVTLRSTFSPDERAAAEARGVTFEPVSLQQLVVQTTALNSRAAAKECTA